MDIVIFGLLSQTVIKIFNNDKKVLSRGRGIKCFNQLDKVLDHIIGKETQYVIQKYMENPMIIQ